MKRLKVLIAFSLVILPALPEVFAQNYQNAIGGRLGYPFGFTIKHFFGTQPAIEGILGLRGRSVEGIVMYEHHFYPAEREEFSLYVGGGGHVGIYGHYPRYWDPDNKVPTPYLAVGLDGIIGVEWTFAEFPLNLGFDWKPGINLYHHPEFLYPDFAISVRYAFR